MKAKQIAFINKTLAEKYENETDEVKELVEAEKTKLHSIEQDPKILRET